MTRPAELDPGMLLFEVAAMLARHGIVASTANPSAARDAASKLLHALGIVPATEPAAIAAAPAATTTAPLSKLPSADDPRWNLELPPAAQTHLDSLSQRPRDRFAPGRVTLPLTVIEGGAS